jgi:hypothetical protein
MKISFRNDGRLHPHQYLHSIYGEKTMSPLEQSQWDMPVLMFEVDNALAVKSLRAILLPIRLPSCNYGELKASDTRQLEKFVVYDFGQNASGISK